MRRIDFRSDTVTKPSDAMRKVMADALVGDDVFGEDPTVNALEKEVAQYFGKEAALFCPSGTQTNQIAIAVHCRPGDEVICAEDAHIYMYEGGGIARNAGASVRLLKGNRGRITANEVESAIMDADNVHFPLTRLVALEDTMNRGGGAIYDFQEIINISTVCKKYNLPLHLDGARVFNALIENGVQPVDYAAPFESISICLSKGLGAPVGSLLLGNKDFIRQARRVRKVFGGGMRQAGIIAAGALYAFRENRERLKVDHENARRIEECLTQLSEVVEVMPVQTNIVVAKMQTTDSAQRFLAYLMNENILAMPFGAGAIRLVTHLDISEQDMIYTLEKITSFE